MIDFEKHVFPVSTCSKRDSHDTGSFIFPQHLNQHEPSKELSSRSGTTKHSWGRRLIKFNSDNPMVGARGDS